MKAFKTIFITEIKLSIRDLNIPIFGIIFPVIVAVVMGLVTGNGPAFEGANYSMIDQSFSSFAAIAICATGLMGLPLQISDYRNKKILKRYMITPINPSMILFIQFLVNLVMSLFSLVILFGVCHLFWGYQMSGNLFLFLLSYLLVTLAMYSIGMLLASISPDIKTANLLCSLVYFPMLLFSGATIPYEIMPKVAQSFMDVLPLTQGIKLMKTISLNLSLNNSWYIILLLLIISLTCTIISVKTFKWE